MKQKNTLSRSNSILQVSFIDTVMKKRVYSIREEDHQILKIKCNQQDLIITRQLVNHNQIVRRDTTQQVL